MNKKIFKRILINIFAKEYMIVIKQGSFDSSVVFHVWPWESFTTVLKDKLDAHRIKGGNYSVIARL